jgi:RNA polymerase sigma-70 factor (ECF subfamily)
MRPVPSQPDFSADLDVRNRILDGDSEAAEAFFRKHLDALYEFVHYRVGSDRALAEDVVQDTFLIALERLRAFDGRSSLHTWLCGIARNKIRAHRRKRRPMLVEDLLEESDFEIDAILAQVESEPLPDWILEKQETQELVGATLSSLPPDYRDVLVHKYIDGKSVADIATERGTKEKAAESTLHRARLAFGKVFSLLAKKRGGFA